MLAVAGGFMGYAVVHTGRTTESGYTLHANFDRADGLAPGGDVVVAGVKVGRITATDIDPKSYQAQITFTVRPDVRLPDDSSAEIASDGLLGGKQLSLVPGGDDKMLPNGGRIQITQSAVSLEQLLGKFIFSVSDLSSNVQKSLKENQVADKPSAPAADKAGLPK